MRGSIPEKPHRMAGIYLLPGYEKSEAKVELVDTGYHNAKILINAEDQKALIELYRGIRSGILTPVESWDCPQAIPKAERENIEKTINDLREEVSSLKRNIQTSRERNRKYIEILFEINEASKTWFLSAIGKIRAILRDKYDTML